MTTTNKPAAVFRDGALKVTIWRNEGENGAWFSCVPSRIYKDEDGKYKETHQLNGAEPLQMSRLLGQAYTKIVSLRTDEKAQAEAGEAA